MQQNRIHLILFKPRQYRLPVTAYFIRASNIDNLASSEDLKASLEE